LDKVVINSGFHHETADGQYLIYHYGATTKIFGDKTSNRFPFISRFDAGNNYFGNPSGIDEMTTRTDLTAYWFSVSAISSVFFTDTFISGIDAYD
jgi:hypothetical protein